MFLNSQSVNLMNRCLFRMKQRQQIADMDSICEAVRMDWANGVVSRMLADGGKDDLKALVHSALGTLIKLRKVYYTGNKGYFLVVSQKNENNAQPIRPFGTLGSQLRHSLRSRSSSQGSGASRNRQLVNQESQTDRGAQSPIWVQNIDENNYYDGADFEVSSPLYSIPNDVRKPNSSTESSPSSLPPLERSQSLRLSKKSMRSLSKGGSLR